MALIRATFNFRGDKPGVREEFFGKLVKSYPKSLKIEDESDFSLSVKGTVDPQAVKKMLRSYVPVDKLISYHFSVSIDGKSFEFGGP